MTEKNSGLSRRKFILAGSAVMASPLLLGVAGSMVGAKPAEARTTATNADNGDKIYYIGHGCIGCQVCRTFCPAGAIHFGDTGNEIDQNRCEHCGTCYEECPNCVVTETDF